MIENNFLFFRKEVVFLDNHDIMHYYLIISYKKGMKIIYLYKYYRTKKDFLIKNIF